MAVTIFCQVCEARNGWKNLVDVDYTHSLNLVIPVLCDRCTYELAAVVDAARAKELAKPAPIPGVFKFP